MPTNSKPTKVIADIFKVFKKIEDGIINEVTDVLSELETNARDANDILSSRVGEHHERIRWKVSRYHDYVKRFV